MRGVYPCSAAGRPIPPTLIEQLCHRLFFKTERVRTVCGERAGTMLFSVTGTHSTRPTKQTTLTLERPQAATAPWRGACSGNQVAGPKARVVQTRAQRVTAHCQQHAHCPRLLSATTSGTPGGPPGFNRTQWGPLHAVGACRPACHVAASARPTWLVGRPQAAARV